MPAKAASLKITEAYRSRMLHLRQQAVAQARRTWSQINPDDLDGTYQVGSLAISVTTFQKEATRASAGYLQAFIESETGEPVRTPLVDARQVGSARSGDDLQKALRSPLIGVKVKIGEGQSPSEALGTQLSALERMVGLATDEAARSSLMKAMVAHPQVTGWQRAVKGTCGACAAAAIGRQDFFGLKSADIRCKDWLSDLDTGFDAPELGEPSGYVGTFAEQAGHSMHYHPNCQCVSEPIVKGISKAGDILRGHPAKEYLETESERYFPFDSDYIPDPDVLPVAQDSPRLWTNSETGYLEPIPHANISALRNYQGHGYEDINLFLRDKLLERRGGDYPSLEDFQAYVDEFIQPRIDKIDDLMRPVGREVEVYRGFGSRDPEAYGFELGKTAVEHGFASTSTSKEVGLNWARTKFIGTVDPETKGVWVDGLLHGFGEDELLVERGSKWVVEKIETIENRYGVEQNTVHGRIMPPGYIAPRSALPGSGIGNYWDPYVPGASPSHPFPSTQYTGPIGPVLQGATALPGQVFSHPPGHGG